MELVREVWTAEDFASLRELLMEKRDPVYKEFHSSLLPADEEVLGVRMPELKAIGKEIGKGNAMAFLSGCPTLYYEEIILRAIVIGGLKLPYDQMILIIDDFTGLISGWGSCDSFVSGLKIIKKYRAEYWNQLQGYLRSPNPWKVRFALVVMLTYYADEEYVDRLLQVAANVDMDHYYVKMANAWMVSYCYLVAPESTTELLRSGLTTEVKRMAIQKIIDSKRVSKEEKAKLRRMR